MTDREMQDFSQTQLMDQGPMHNSGIDIPKRKDKEDLTESSEVCLSLSHRNTHNPKRTVKKINEVFLLGLWTFYTFYIQKIPLNTSKIQC